MTPRRITYRAVTWFVAAVATAGLLRCTDAELEPIPVEPLERNDKLTVEGRLCTLPPDTRVFPLRVLFVVDASESMAISDPPDPQTGETRRQAAVRAAWTELLDEGAAGDVRIGIVRFAAEAQSRTGVDHDGDGEVDGWFTADPQQLSDATDALAETSRTTNYANALGEAWFEVRTELVAAEAEALPLSRYVVIFLSDGLPDAEANQAGENTDDAIAAGVAAIRELADQFRVGEIVVHTAYLSSGRGPALDQAAQALLRRMADVGGGTFRDFPAGQALDFLHLDLTVARRVFTLRSFVATNLNTLTDQVQLEAIRAAGVEPGLLREVIDVDGDGRAGCGEPLIDSDRDGLSDALERAAGTDPDEADSDADGVGDRVEWQLRSGGLDPLRPDETGCLVPGPCADTDDDGACDCLRDRDVDGVCDCVADPGDPCVGPGGRDCVDDDGDGWCDCRDDDGDGNCDRADRDGDGLADCEELFIGTLQNGSDSDADGLPDVVELRAGTSPVDPDGVDDLDLDRVSNEVEARSGNDPLCDDSLLRSRVAASYSLRDEGIADGRSCHALRVADLRLAPTRPRADDAEDGWNRILLFAGEAAYDDPGAFARFRVACVDARYDLALDARLPEEGVMTLDDDDFRPVADFRPDEHCRRAE